MKYARMRPKTRRRRFYDQSYVSIWFCIEPPECAFPDSKQMLLCSISAMGGLVAGFGRKTQVDFLKGRKRHKKSLGSIKE